MNQKMSIKELENFLHKEFPQAAKTYRIKSFDGTIMIVQMNTEEKHLRPGRTVSGPTMFALADVSVYLIVLANIGPKALTVTTNCSIDFMRRPSPGLLYSETKLLKLGRRLAVGEVLIFSEGTNQPVVRANLTYSIPD